jgi:hypothetical protein
LNHKQETFKQEIFVRRIIRIVTPKTYSKRLGIIKELHGSLASMKES